MAQDRELKELKSVLRSLVVSSPTQVDVRSLLRDYRSMMGAPVPIIKYGYRDPLQFLKERCSDSFVFQGPPSNPILTLIVPETLKHIDQFVQKQKVSSNVKFKGKRRSIPEQAMKPKDLIYNTFVPKQVEVNRRTIQKPVKINENIDQKQDDLKTKSIQKPPEVNITNNLKSGAINRNSKEAPIEINQYTTSDNNKNPINIKSNTNSIQDVRSTNDKVDEHLSRSDKENKQANANAVGQESHSKNAVLNFLKKRMPMYSSSQIESEASYDCKGDDDSGRQTSSSSSSTKAALLEELKVEIRDLIADFPDGIWCTDLISLYRERYNRELNFSRFGYTSIISLVCVLEDVVRTVRPLDTGDWLLTDARAHAAVPCPRRRAPVAAAAHAAHAAHVAHVAHVAPVRHARAAHVDVDDALPGIDFDPDVFPVDCVHFMETIPPPSLSGLETGAMLEAMVGEVYSPSHFWLLRLGEQYNIAMEDMMDEMTNYYTYEEGKDRSLALGAVRVGHYCSSVYERDWHRSLIVRIVDSDTVKVRHVDYGTVESVLVRDLKPLKRCWGALPAQAVRARLAAVRPPAAGRRWPHAACAHFLGLVRDRRLVANVVALDREEDILEVFLIDTSTEEDVCINTELIRSGHADARSDSALRTPECYLFPRFDVLEGGDTPNFGEIHAYLRDGIALEYVEEYRRHVPACLPPDPPPPPTPPLHSPGPSPPPSPPPGHAAASLAASDTASDAASDASGGTDRSSRPPTPGEPPSPRQLTRAASSPGESSPPHAPNPPTRSKSAHPNIATSDACPDVINRVPLWPQQAPRPKSPRHPPPRAPAFRLRRPGRPLPHEFTQMHPMPYAGFPPFPGAVPMYPPMYAPPAPPMLLPHGPFIPAPYGPPLLHAPPCAPYPPVSHAQASRLYPDAAPVSQGPLHSSYSYTSPTSVTTSTPASINNQTPPAPTPVAPREVSPPPPYNGARASEPPSVPPGEVTLSVSECEIYKLLSKVDTNAAHWYMVDAISRAMRATAAGATAPVSSTLDPNAPEYRHAAPTFSMPPGLRPPPGFGY